MELIFCRPLPPSPVFDVLLPDESIFFLHLRCPVAFANQGIERDAAGITGNKQQNRRRGIARRHWFRENPGLPVASSTIAERKHKRKPGNDHRTIPGVGVADRTGFQENENRLQDHLLLWRAFTETEENNLKQAPALIVGTPGRLADHIRRGNINTSHFETLVLDEFDKSLEEGFEEEMAFIIGSLPALKKRILTSATEALEIPPFVGMEQPTEINFLKGEKSPALAVQMVSSDDEDKSATLFRLICALGNRSTIIFCNQREFVEEVSAFLKNEGIPNVYYHGALEQQERDVALCKFRNGTSNILVTTDLAARGLDIPNIRYVIHYQLPIPVKPSHTAMVAPRVWMPAELRS